MSKGQTKKTQEAAGNRRKLTRAEKKQIAAVIRQAKGCLLYTSGKHSWVREVPPAGNALVHNLVDFPNFPLLRLVKGVVQGFLVKLLGTDHAPGVLIKIRPVSYTHLDVYKRQAPGMPGRSMQRR